MTGVLGVMSKWLANGCDGSQMAAGKFATVCGHLNAKRINILSISLLESITAPNHPLFERQDRCSIFSVLCYF